MKKSEITDEDILENWTSVNRYLRIAKSHDEPRIWDLIQQERNGKRRHQVLVRLYSKANRLRMQREREAMFVAVPL